MSTQKEPIQFPNSKQTQFAKGVTLIDIVKEITRLAKKAATESVN
ncbi:hypothetical protein SAMN06295926_11577 [Lysinibacillus sp. AC-3]|nr:MULTISPECIES: hypothetical protein [unclassified Lysinibacillus]SKB98697.1 hypothetical protein SAMN06295926_11577 [Lysinibacillus sp. AC-3]